MRPGESMVEGLKKFFINTLNRNGRGQRLGVEVPVSLFGTGKFLVSYLSGDYDNQFSGLNYGQRFHKYSLPIPVQPCRPTSPSLVQNRSAHMQSSWNISALSNTNDFVPRPLCHSNASQLFNTLVVHKTANRASVEAESNSTGTGTYIPDEGIEKKLKLQSKGTLGPHMGFEGESTCVHDMGLEEKLKLQDIGTSGPDIGIEKELRSQGTVCDISDIGIVGNFKLGGTGTCIPAMGIEEKAKAPALGKYILGTSVEEQTQGTGTLSFHVGISLKFDIFVNLSCFSFGKQ